MTPAPGSQSSGNTQKRTSRKEHRVSTARCSCQSIQHCRLRGGSVNDGASMGCWTPLGHTRPKFSRAAAVGNIYINWRIPFPVLCAGAAIAAPGRDETIPAHCFSRQPPHETKRRGRRGAPFSVADASASDRVAAPPRAADSRVIKRFKIWFSREENRSLGR